MRMQDGGVETSGNGKQKCAAIPKCLRRQSGNENKGVAAI